MQAILGRIRSLEQSVAALEEVNDLATEREIKWAEMNSQLRRYLGRLDAHAGKARAAEEETVGRHAPRADVLAAKFPNGVPTKE